MAAADDRAGSSAFVGQAPSVVRIRARIELIASSLVPVLILGETGTGKEVCAAEIARLSRRKPFIAVNCAAFSEALADSELFGYERGAFTGAHKDHSGLVAEANGGILFLDELSEIAPPVQAKLLRALESGEYRRVGATRILLSNFRLLAATNGDPDALVGEHKLRADLMYRLGALRITLPTLRERLEDLPLLANLFLHRYRDRAGHGPVEVSPDALQLLTEQDWPGNIRQLRNVMEAAAAIAGTSKAICRSHIVQLLEPSAPAPVPIESAPTFAEALRRAEITALADALSRAQGNRSRAARILGISEATLFRKLAKHRLPNISG